MASYNGNMFGVKHEESPTQKSTLFGGRTSRFK